MSRRTAAGSSRMRRNAVTRSMDFFARDRSVSVLLILLVVLGLGGLALRLFVFHSWFLWFWAMTALIAFELLAIAFWDLIVELRGSGPHLVTDQPAPWGPWMQWSVVPLLLIAGILVDHFVTH